MNEFFSIQNHLVNLGHTDKITDVWDCLDHIRTKDIHPAEVGFTLEVIQLASDWNNQYTEDFEYLNKFINE